jgi:hypothetical protein
MKKFFLAFFVAIIPTIITAAEQQKPKKPETATTLHPSKRNPCAQYGPGFVQVADTTMCVKVGGGVTVESGRR